MSKRTKRIVTPDKYAADTDAWLTHGKIIYEAARALFDAGDTYPTLYFSAATLAHTCLEVLMKGILIEDGMVSFNPREIKQLPPGTAVKKEDCVWGHSLLELAKQLEQRAGFDLADEMGYHNVLFQAPFPVRRALEHFEPFFSELRYAHGLEQVSCFGAGDEKILEELVVRILALKQN